MIRGRPLIMYTIFWHFLPPSPPAIIGNQGPTPLPTAILRNHGLTPSPQTPHVTAELNK